MKLIPISAGNFHCDGGALFGVIPKVLWNKVYPSNENNFTKLALRCLLVDQGDRRILIETGIGNHYPDKYLKNNGYTPGDYLEESLAEYGYSCEEITDVFLTHLHWDHASGALVSIDGKLNLRFPNATYWCSKVQWEHSKISNKREKVAYHSGILNFLFESGQLKLVEKKGELLPNVKVRFYNGHTPGQMIPFISYKGKNVVYTADLVPTAANIPLLWIASYDLNPVQVMEEKDEFLKEVAEKNYILFFEHDYYTECATIILEDKGFRLKKAFKISEI